MMKRFKLYKTLIIFICLFLLGANIRNGVITDSFICSHKYVFRIVRDVNFELVPGRFYTPKELVQRGYTLEEITLEGIVKPEAIPEDEEFIIYEVSKDGEEVGWLWEGKFLDRDGLEEKYNFFVKTHARIDEILEKGRLDKDVQKSLDMQRNKTHLWAKLFKSELLKTEVKTSISRKIIVDIVNERIKLQGYKEFPKIFKDFDFPGVYKFDEDKIFFRVYTDEKTHKLSDSSIRTFIKIMKGIQEFNPFLVNINYDEEFEFTHRGALHGYWINYYDIIIDIDYLAIVKKMIEFLYHHSELKGKSYKRDEIVRTIEQSKWRNVLDEKGLSRSSLLLGNKAENLKRLEEMKVRVPCFQIVEGQRGRIKGVPKDLILDKVTQLEGDKKFGQKSNPLLLSIRSSPPISMPGVLDTIINVGINDEIAVGLAEKYGEKFAYETYARFLRSFGIGIGIKKEVFGNIPPNLDTQRAKELVERYKVIILNRSGLNRLAMKEILQNPYKQLYRAFWTVYSSWDSRAAERFRAENGIRDDLVMAVIIQEMKFGNLNENSGSFVLFTRDPITGEKGLYIEYAPQSQGDALVGGEVNPVPIEESSLSEEIREEIKGYAEKIEKEFGYAQDIEGVVEDGKVWILQTRDAKLSSEAEIKALVDMVEEGILTKEEALMRINLEDLEDRLSHMQIDPTARVNPIATGLGASSGAVQGVIAFDLETVSKFKDKGLPVILVKKEFYPATHLDELVFSDGLLTQIGGKLSHGAIQGRIHEKPTIIGADIEVDIESKTVIIGGKTYKQGDYITIDGTNGDVYEGRVDLIEPEEVNPYLEILKRWYEEINGEEI